MVGGRVRAHPVPVTRFAASRLQSAENRDATRSPAVRDSYLFFVSFPRGGPQFHPRKGIRGNVLPSPSPFSTSSSFVCADVPPKCQWVFPVWWIDVDGGGRAAEGAHPSWRLPPLAHTAFLHRLSTSVSDPFPSSLRWPPVGMEPPARVHPSPQISVRNPRRPVSLPPRSNRFNGSVLDLPRYYSSKSMNSVNGNPICCQAQGLCASRT